AFHCLRIERWSYLLVWLVVHVGMLGVIVSVCYCWCIYESFAFGLGEYVLSFSGPALCFKSGGPLLHMRFEIGGDLHCLACPPSGVVLKQSIAMALPILKSLFVPGQL
ncbi:unnamed protein product, partial [Choristocarpus tenellus]